ncbi:MAG: DNA repair protein RecO [Fusicatenibacter sp.]|nr:DNA repair protein RecO [Fusicatenibacter sp.]
MSEEVQVTGMVLSVMPIGEYDKRVVLLTRERGKITAFARGARRLKSPLMAATTPFAFGTFEVYEGRNSYTMKSARIREYFQDLTGIQPGIYYGFYFLELADYFGQEGNDETQMLNLLYVSVNAIRKGILNLRLIRRIYELRIMTVNGEYPQVFSCQECGSSEHLKVFSLRDSAIYCENCAGEVKDPWPLRAATIVACQYIISAPLERLYAFSVTEEILEELERLMNAYLNRYLDRKMKSLEILEAMI